MIQITIPLSCITIMSEEYQSEKKNSVKKKEKDGIRRFTIADALKLNSLKRGDHEDGDNEREPFRFKIAGS
ncbi:MAG: hypothetical protein AABY79_07470 [Nitrospirota bacterium]